MISAYNSRVRRNGPKQLDLILAKLLTERQYKPKSN